MRGREDLDMARKPLSTAFGAWTVNFTEVISAHLSGLLHVGQRHQTSKTPNSLASSEQNAITGMKRKALLIVQEGRSSSPGGITASSTHVASLPRGRGTCCGFP